jgi:hypothetical protein
MGKLTADQARDLANQYHDLSVVVGDYRFDHWDDLSSAKRRRLEDLQWTLINYSSDFTAPGYQPDAIGLERCSKRPFVVTPTRNEFDLRLSL